MMRAMPKPPSVIAMLVLAAFAASAAPGCMTAVLQMERKHPSSHSSVVSSAGLGLVGDALLSVGAAAVHAEADEDPETAVADLLPYYAAPLLILDAILFVVIVQNMAK
jgi:hypothetical protein